MVSALHSLHTPPAGSRPDANWPGYYNISQAAALLGVSRMSIWRWIRAGRLPVLRLGHRISRIRREDLEQFLAGGEAAASRLRVVPDGTTELPDSDGLGQQRAPGETASEPGQAKHVVQFYEVDAVLVEAVSAYIGTALRGSGVGIVIATAAHRAAIEASLEAAGLDLDTARAGGRYLALDAAATLAGCMVEGEPQPEQFAAVVGSLIAEAVETGQPVHAFGEMVALLAAEGNHAAALRLEALWNGLQKVHTFSLFCAYPMAVLSGEGLIAVFDDVAGEHSEVIPLESRTALDDPDDRRREVARLQQQAASLRVAVAARQQAEERLRQSERELRDFVENATEGLQWVGPDGRIIWANHAELELLGYAAEEYIGRPIADFHADPDVIADILQRLTAGEELHNYEARLRAKDGSIKHVLINSNVYRENGRFVHTRCFTRDITGQKRDEEAVNRLAAIVASSDDAIIAKTLDGTIVDWNGGAERLYGYSAAEIIGRPIALLVPADRPDELPAIMERLQRGERIDHYETERVTKDGRRLCVSVTISPLRDGSGRIVGASAIARDISERRAMERLQQDFLAMVSHELRNPLTSVKGLAQLMQRRGAYNPRAVEGIIAQTNHLNRLIGDLLDVTRLEAGRLELQCEPLDLVAFVAESLDQARAQAPDQIFTLAAPASPVPGCYDRDRLHQVLQNLLSNAIKYAPDGAVAVRVTIDNAYARISVSDQGPGISADDSPKLFDRFYRAAATADGAKGFGIGLYVARMLVEAHGGRIWVESRPGQGCEFTFTLPLDALDASRNAT
jgi:PAS domain S-box-containing protein/excisionase family DNA binding protein